VTFNVSTDTYAGLDGNGPGTGPQTIHTDSDAMNSTADNPLQPGAFTQVGSASSSTEIAGPDGQEVDIFYNDGVNWPRAHNGTIPCFAGYTGFLGLRRHRQAPPTIPLTRRTPGGPFRSPPEGPFLLCPIIGQKPKYGRRKADRRGRE
jgi:hypothetical protein